MPPLYSSRPAMAPQEFVAKWRPITTSERASAQSHFNDLCQMLGVPTPHEDDPTGERYAFERRATKTGGPTKGKQGWADVWKRGAFAWEYKGPHADLDKAYQQLLQYRESLENPPLLVVSDIQTILVHTNFPNSVKQIHTWELDDLIDARRRDELRRVWTEPFALRPTTTAETVTQTAAREFARLAELLRARGEDPERAAHFLIRVLFCLFAEDSGTLLPNQVFTRLVTATLRRPETFSAQLRLLFDAMRYGGVFALEQIPRFNGNLFDSDDVLDLDGEALGILARISGLDWGAIEPSILGTLFERSLDPGKRAQLGAHYTSREDILLIVEPVLMAPLRRRWKELQEGATALAARRDAASGGQRTRLDNELRTMLLGFQHEIASTRVLDPACGSGNFLYVALKQLLDLEKEVIVFMGELGLTRPFPQVSPEQLSGIELNEYAHELAQTTVWIGFIQWLRENGFGHPSEPILKPMDNIRHMDAILAYDEEGRPIEPEWPAADVIIGNPPFLGGSKLRRELGDTYSEAVWSLYEGRVPAGADLVTYWFERARALIEQHQVKRAGLLATNSIRFGANRRSLERIKESGDIFMAWSDRAWVLDGAAVRVSMVGFDNGSESQRHLDGQAVAIVNADLTATTDVSSAPVLAENAGLAFQGVMKAGPFDIDAGVARTLLDAPLNPNGRPNSDVVKLRLGGQDVTGRPRGGWVIDFGVDMPESEAALYELPFEHVRTNVKPIRDQNRDEWRRTHWWLHGRSRPALRAAIRNLQRCIVTAEVSKHRMFVWMPTNTIPDSTCHVIARDDDYFFGVLQSRIHELWSLAVGNYMGVGNTPRYNSERIVETFTFPWAPGVEPVDDQRVQAIAQAAVALVELRDRWLNPPGAGEAELKKRTLTNLYNARPSWLQNAHKQLDDAVLDAYGWPHDLSDDEILARLLALNLERAGQHGVVAAREVDEE